MNKYEKYAEFFYRMTTYIFTYMVFIMIVMLHKESTGWESYLYQVMLFIFCLIAITSTFYNNNSQERNS